MTAYHTTLLYTFLCINAAVMSVLEMTILITIPFNYDDCAKYAYMSLCAASIIHMVTMAQLMFLVCFEINVAVLEPNNCSIITKKAIEITLPIINFISFAGTCLAFVFTNSSCYENNNIILLKLLWLNLIVFMICLVVAIYLLTKKLIYIYRVRNSQNPALQSDLVYIINRYGNGAIDNARDGNMNNLRQNENINHEGLSNEGRHDGRYVDINVVNAPENYIGSPKHI